LAPRARYVLIGECWTLFCSHDRCR
jgi:hypothetical protein